MSVRTGGQRRFITDGSRAMLANATSMSVFLRKKFDPQSDPAKSIRYVLFGGEGGSSFQISYGGAGATVGTVRTRFRLMNHLAQATYKDVDLAVGVNYALGLVFAPDGNRFYVDGERYELATLSGSMSPHPVGYGTGLWDYNPQIAAYVEDLALWSNHALSDSQMEGLRDGVLSPLDILGGTWQGYWPMKGPEGSEVKVGDPGLANLKAGQPAGDFPLRNALGDGAATYGPSLAWRPSAEAGDVHVGTSGRTVFVTMRGIESQQQTLCRKLNHPPRVSIDGRDVGPLTPIVVNGKQSFSAYRLPPGERIGDRNRVKISAPANWMSTVAGASSAFSDGDVLNYAGRSCFRPEGYVKTLRMGVNTEYAPCDFRSLGQYTKNIRFRLGSSRQISEFAGDGTPTAFAYPYTSASVVLYTADGDNGLDETGFPGPVGLVAVQYNDRRPFTAPTSIRITPRYRDTTEVVARPEYDNPGVLGEDGVLRGIVKVFQVKRAAGSTRFATSFAVTYGNPTGRMHVDSVVIQHEKDFTPGTPTVLDDSDPYALSETFKDIWRGAGSIRCWTSLISGVTSSIFEREHLRQLGDYTWSQGRPKATRSIRFTRAEPFRLSDCPYIYYQQFGERYGATLDEPAQAVEPLSEDVLRIARDEGPGNEILIGSRLFLGDEVARVVDCLPDDRYRVIRGIEGTTPAAHEPGRIEVGFRAQTPAPGRIAGESWWSNGHYVKLTTQAPHGLPTGFCLSLDSAWPVFAFADGYSQKPNEFGGMVVVGRDSMVVKVPPWHDASLPSSTLAEPVDLDPETCKAYAAFPSQEQLPYAMHSRAANQLDSPTCFYSLPLYGTDDCYHAIAEEIRDNLDRGRLAYIEIGCEEWNFNQQKQFFFMASTAMLPGQTLWATYLLRYARAREIFGKAFGDRAQDLRFYINQQAVNVRSELFDFMESQTPPIRIDATAIAPYISHGDNYLPDETQEAFAQLDPDEILDLWIHTLWNGIGYGPKHHAAAWTRRMATYTERTGFPCELVSYEGGVESIESKAHQYGLEKQRDCFYHPNMYIVGQDMFALFQESGYKRFNYFCSFADFYKGMLMWGLYKYHYHPYGRGDGSDGKANNLLCLAVPGQEHSKRPDQNQDLENVSVLGLAWLDWNKDFLPIEDARAARRTADQRRPGRRRIVA